MANGQADAGPAEGGQAGQSPDTLDELAKFLVDNPEADAEETEPHPEDPDADGADKSKEADDDGPAEDPEDSESEEAKKRTSTLKFKVPVKGDDGTDTTVEVDEKELIAGYQRRAEFTRKTMELADKEREVTQAVVQELDKGREHYMRQAQLARAAIVQLAGLKTPQEMALLAQTDHGTWIAETQRQQIVQTVLGQIEQGMQREQHQTLEQQKKQLGEQVQKAWGTLGQKGIDKPKLLAIYETVSSKYGIPPQRLAGVTDPALIEVFRDAAAYQGLKEKSAAAKKKVGDAPPLPTQRQRVPKNEAANQKLEGRFRSGRAKLNDLAAYLSANDL